MTPKCTTWDKLGRFAGRGLLIVNSPPEDRESLVLVLEALTKVLDPAQISAIASPSNHQLLRESGVVPGEILSTRFEGQDLELNYLLERPDLIEWVSQRRPQIITGSLAHSLYNDETKDLFEQRVGFFLGNSSFLAHTLPNAYVYVLGAQEMSRRIGRHKKIEEYRRTAGNLLEALHQHWHDLGRPAADDESGFENETVLLAEHLGEDLLDFDERSRIPVARTDFLDEVVTFWNHETSSYIHRSSTRLAELKRRLEAQTSRVSMLERELAQRDAVLEKVRQQIDDLTSQMQHRDHEVQRRDELLHQVQNQVQESLVEVGKREDEIRKRDDLLRKAQAQIDDLMGKLRVWDVEVRKWIGLVYRARRQAKDVGHYHEDQKDALLREAESRTEELIQRIESQDVEVQKRDGLLRKVQEQVQESLVEVRKREIEIQKRDELLSGTQRQIQESLLEIGKREDEIRKRDDLLRRTQKQIDELAKEIERRDTEIRKRDELLHEVQQQVQQTLEEVATRELEIQKRDDLLQGQQVQIAELEKKVTSLSQETAERGHPPRGRKQPAGESTTVEGGLDLLAKE